MQCYNTEDFARLLRENVLQHKLDPIPGVIPLLEFFIWVTKGDKKTYNLILIMPRAQMSLNELLKKK